MTKYLKKCVMMLITLILVTNMLSLYTSAEATNKRILISEAQSASDSGGGGKTSGYNDKMKSLIDGADKAEGDWTSEAGTNVESSVNDVMGILIIVARIIGVTVAVGMLLVLAMKYMTAAPGEKAEIKKSAVVYIVGAIILFATTGILGIIGQFASGISI